MTVLLASGAQYSVAASSAQATINWSSLSVQYSDLSSGANAPQLSWLYGLGAVDTNAYTANTNDFQQDSGFAEDLITALSINSTTTQAQSSALRTSATLQANATTQAGTGSVTDTNEANASAYNYAEFELLGNGSALITVEWTASVSGAVGNWDDYAYAAAFINGNFDDGNGNSGSSASSNAYYSSEEGVFNFNGVFSMNIFSDGIHTVSGAINAEAVAAAYSPVSQVPVPNAIWLFASGLMGVLGISHRRQFAA
ncbi:hypothetical protein [Methylomonas sp. TEB]|uniref:hypothetical protein n=1 Tax=Methylomonas sp. TEB TaxID=3398229 RepID=UPI0039F46A52